MAQRTARRGESPCTPTQQGPLKTEPQNGCKPFPQGLHCYTHQVEWLHLSTEPASNLDRGSERAPSFKLKKLALSHDKNLAQKILWNKDQGLVYLEVQSSKSRNNSFSSFYFKAQVHFLQVLPKVETLRHSKHWLGGGRTCLWGQ